MDSKDFIIDALNLPNDSIAYHVGRRLAELHPDKSVVTGQSWSFNLDEFVRDNRCSLVHKLTVHRQTRTLWRGSGESLGEETENGWLNVLWEGHLFDVVLLTYYDGFKVRRHWIVAESREVGEGFFRSVCRWCSEPQDQVLVFEDGCWSKNERLFQAIKSASFENLVLPDDFKRQMQDDFSRFLSSRETYEKYGVPWKRGVIFIGPPGNGKTHTVKALVNYLNRPCLYVKSFKSQYGTRQENMREVFERARQSAPCIMVLEDLDSLITGKTRSFFLNEMDGFASNAGLMTLATTNYPERLDAAIMDRPSRFDRKYHFALPKAEERLAFARRWSRSGETELNLSEETEERIVSETEGFSYAYLKELFVSSVMQWMASPAAEDMASILMSRVAALREEMKSAKATA
jgi:AAA+ superfamily predicted ATPase